MNRNYPDGWTEYEVNRHCISGGREYGKKTLFRMYLVRLCVGVCGVNDQR